MNVPTITMDPKLAEAKLKAYRADLHKDSEELYTQTAAAYEELAKGATLLRLSQAIEGGGLDEQGRPRLAICRADRREVKVRKIWRDPILIFAAGPFDIGGRQSPAAERSPTLTREVPLRMPLPDVTTGFALVPMVPADIRPKHGHLKDWYILWEVDHWADRPHNAKASRDPLLLKHLAGDLYAVLACWDLTPIEQAILEGAMRS